MMPLALVPRKGGKVQFLPPQPKILREYKNLKEAIGSYLCCRLIVNSIQSDLALESAILL